MQFSKLRLVGFKSFVEATEFEIERGLTGVVGPNGCGKSNLVEAMRWVMGEASYKNMRASSMDDVIFQGSGKRPARNSAEVSLHLLNDDRSAPAAFNDADELQVSRRIEREAGSVYRVNGRDVRAKDVQLLFADVSTGARSPSMIGQGRIGELISAKPVARRAVLEEAAGISGLHARRHEAELRLRATETNLDRIEDVVVQLEAQLNSLKRQARQAARYRNVAGDIRRTEAAILHLRWRSACEAARTAEAVVQAATVALAEAGLVQSDAVRVQAIVAHELPTLREAEAAQAATLQHARIASEQLDREEAERSRQKRELTGRIEQLNEDRSREQGLVEDSTAMLASLEAESRDLAEVAAEEADGRAALAAALDLARADVAAAEAASELATTALATARATRAGALGRLAQGEDQLAIGERRRRQLEDTIADIDSQIERKAGIETLKGATEESARLADDAEGDATERFAAVEVARTAAAEERAPLDALRARHSALEAEAATLGRVLQQGDEHGSSRPVLDEVVASPGYERALATALGSDLDASTDTEASIHWTVPDAKDDPALPSAADSLIDRVEAPTVLHRRLSQVGVVDGEPDAATLASLRPGQCLVTREGALWRWDGLRSRADAVTPAAQRLQQRNRLAEVEAELAGSSDKLARVERTVFSAEEALRESLSAAQDARRRSQSAREARDDAAKALAKAERATGELSDRRLVTKDQLARAREDAPALVAAVAEAREALALLPDVADEERLAADARQRTTVARAAAVEAERDQAAFTRAGEGRADRAKAIEREVTVWQARVEAARRQIDIVDGRLVEAREQSVALQAEPDAFEARRRKILTAIAEAEVARKGASDRLTARENDLRDADRAAHSALAALSSAKEAVARAEERAASAGERRVETEARIRDVLRCAPHEALAIADEADDADLPDMPTLERRLEKLRGERERLGAVNLRADEEADDLTARRDELVRERDDLVEAIRKLRGAIGNLNREGRERLLVAFERVDREFARLFTHLFGGGTASLQLVESDDPLEAGLEIIARPPGKKPQTMTLLSGGEQALTAMALIFAVFLTNPSPICVLDEVDAPLDDHNVARFCNLMDEMAAKTDTRFVIITHNPITMARMDRLFGVTMSERGVSQLVSVELGEAEVLAEAS